MIATEYCVKVFDGTHDSPKPVEFGRMLITSKHIANRCLDTSDAYLISEEDFAKVNERSQVHQWDILFSMIGTVGNVYLETSKHVEYAIKNMGVFSCQDKEKAYWLYYYLQSPFVKAKIDAFMAGAVQKFLPLGFLRSLEIPPYTKRERDVVAVLSALDDKIALNKKMNQKLEAMAKRLYDYWFVQFDFPDENGHPYKTTGGKMEYNPTLKREIPAGWEVKRLGDLFETNRGVSYSTPTLGAEGDGVPMINLASFSPNESYNEKGIKYYKGDYTDEKVLKPFDFVMCNTQQTAIDPQKDIIGRSMLVPDIFDGDIVSSHHVNTIKLEKENLKFYLNRLFNTKFYHAYISKFANGTNILGLIFSGVEDYMCEIPSDDLLEKFAKISLDIEKKKSKIIKENQKLTVLRDKLLPLLMNGQVMVEQ